jgi:hypothetical protein
LVAAAVAAESHHAACSRLLDHGEVGIYVHGLAECFSTLTGGRKAFRLSPQQAAEILEDDYVPLRHIRTLTPGETLRSIRECQSRGVQGAAGGCRRSVAERPHERSRGFQPTVQGQDAANQSRRDGWPWDNDVAEMFHRRYATRSYSCDPRPWVETHGYLRQPLRGKYRESGK